MVCDSGAGTSGHAPRLGVSDSVGRLVRCDLLGTTMGMCAQRYTEVLLRDRLSFRSVGYSYYPFYWKHTDTPLSGRWF